MTTDSHSHHSALSAHKLAVAFLITLLGLFALPVQAVMIKATPDRDPVRLDETFNVVFSSDDSVDGDPDFSPLERDFDILGQNQGSQFSIVNGKMSRRQEWTLTLGPKHPGAVPIPPIAFGKDRSQAGSVTVMDANAAPSATAPRGNAEEAEIKLEVEAEPKNPYLQAQVIYTVRVLLRVNLAGADLSEPVAEDALIERLSDDQRYSTVRNGRNYTAIERKYAVFPQKSGLLRIEPMKLTAQVEVGGRSFFARPTRPVQVKSEAVDLQVRPIPAAFTGKHWLPATELSLEQTWPQNPPKAKAGEPLTRTLSLRAAGATVGVLPELGAELLLDPSIKQYPDQPSLNEDKSPTTGITSSRQEKTALIPARGGKFTLPAIEVPWWNTRTDKMEIAKIPAVALNVEGAGEPSGAAASVPAQPQTLAETAAGNVLAPSASTTQAVDEKWFWLAVFFAFGWLATGLAWWRDRRAVPPPQAKPIKSQPTDQLSPVRKALRLACTQNEPAAARAALLQWAGIYWSAHKPASLDEIGQLGGAALAEETAKLNRVLFSPAGEAWRGDRLLTVIESLSMTKAKQPGRRESLESLYH